jgi:hypothetical protein
MEPVVVVTLVAVALIVVVVAGHLIAIALKLRAVSSKLAVVIDAVGAIPGKTDPADPIIEAINGDLGEAAGALESRLAKKVARGPLG